MLDRTQIIKSSTSLTLQTSEGNPSFPPFGSLKLTFSKKQFIIDNMKSVKIQNRTLPIFVERDKDGFYVVECPILRGCYSQGKTLDEALKNIREVIELLLEEKETQKILKTYQPKEISLHTIKI